MLPKVCSWGQYEYRHRSTTSVFSLSQPTSVFHFPFTSTPASCLNRTSSIWRVQQLMKICFWYFKHGRVEFRPKLHIPAVREEAVRPWNGTWRCRSRQSYLNCKPSGIPHRRPTANTSQDVICDLGSTSLSSRSPRYYLPSVRVRSKISLPPPKPYSPQLSPVIENWLHHFVSFSVSTYWVTRRRAAIIVTPGHFRSIKSDTSSSQPQFRHSSSVFTVVLRFATEQRGVALATKFLSWLVAISRALIRHSFPLRDLPLIPC